MCSYGAYKHNMISLENKPSCNYAAFTGPAHVLKSQRLKTMKPCGKQGEVLQARQMQKHICFQVSRRVLPVGQGKSADRLQGVGQELARRRCVAVVGTHVGVRLLVEGLGETCKRSYIN